MRERLIDLLNYIPCKAETCADVDGGRCGDLDKLCRCQIEVIADHLLANGVIVPPCKVGDILWFLDYDLPKCFICPEQIVIQDIVLLKNTMLIRCSSSITLRTEDFGKTVFLSPEEAEKALRKEDEGK